MSYKFQKGDAKLGGAVDAQALSGSLAASALTDLSSDNLSEGSTNVYYTDARVHAAVSAGTGLDYDAAGEFSISDGGVDTTQLAADAVDGTKIADDSVDSEHIVDGAVDLAHLAADSVDGTKIADDSVDSEHIAAGAIDFEHFAAGSVSGSALADAGVGSAKIAELDSFDTDALSEGSNLYYTDARVHAALSAGVGLGYDGSGEFSIPNLSVSNDMLSGSIANAKLVNDSVTLTAGAGMAAIGEVDLGASITVAVAGVLEDLDTLGAPTADGEFIVATGAGEFAYESGNTARTSLGLGTGDSPSFTAVSASNGFATNGVVQAGQVQASTFNGDSVAVTGITGSLNNALSAGDGIADFTYDNGDGPKTVALSSSVAGEGLAFSSGVLSLDFSELTDATLDVTADHLVYMDAGGNSRREDVGHFVGSIAGDGLTESAGQLVVGVDDSSIERSGDALRVKASGITNAMLNGSIDDGKLNTITAADKVAGSAVQLKSDGGLVNDSGLALSSSVAGEGLSLSAGVLSVVHTVTDAGNTDFNVAYGVNFQSSNMTGPVTASLPTVASGDEGKTVIIKVRNADQQTVRVQAAGSQNIDGSGDDLLIESSAGAITLVALSAAAGWAII